MVGCNFSCLLLFSNVGMVAVSSLTLIDGAGSSCTLADGVGVFFPRCGFNFYCCCRNSLAVVLKIASNLLSWSIPLSSIVVIDFTLNPTVIYCSDFMTVFRFTFGFLMYLCFK